MKVIRSPAPSNALTGFNFKPTRLAVVAFGLIVGGAFGNLVDRLVRGPGWGRGGVIDFIDVQVWPVFNIADSALSIGVVLMMVNLVRLSRAGTHR